MTDEVNDFLAHFGVKGMHWGVRKDRESGSGRSRSSVKKEDLSEHEKNVLKAADKQGLTEDRMRRMYGPDEPSRPGSVKSVPKAGSGFHLTPADKTAIKFGLIAGGTAVTFYGLKKLGESAILKQQLGQYRESKNLTQFWKDYTKHNASMALSEKDVLKFSTEPVHIKAGGIVKRISTKKEQTIKMSGFFAAYKDEDVERYKGVLPVYWKLWGIDQGDGGYVVNLRAKTDIKAPSHKATFDLFEEFLDTDARFGHKQRDLYDPNVLKKMYGQKPGKHVSTHDIALQHFRDAALAWKDSDDDMTSDFFKFIKERGYNALVDANDAQHLADEPLRIFDGNMFEIAGHERLTPTKIRAAQETLLKVEHSIFGTNQGEPMSDEVEEFLEHMGVKGMRWGVRKKIYGEAGGADRSHRQRVAIEGAGGVAGAAVAYKLAGRSGKFVVPVAIGSAVAVGGAMAARKIIDAHGHKSIHDVLETKPAGKEDKNFDPNKPMSDAEINKKLKQFYQANPHLGVDASNF